MTTDTATTTSTTSGTTSNTTDSNTSTSTTGSNTATTTSNTATSTTNTSTKIGDDDDVVVTAPQSYQGTIQTTSSYVLTGSYEYGINDAGQLVLDIGDDYEASTAIPRLFVYLTARQAKAKYPIYRLVKSKRIKQRQGGDSSLF